MTKKQEADPQPDADERGRRPWAIHVVVDATEEDARAATEAIARALCPDNLHDGLCPVPWSLMMCTLADMDEAEQESWREEFAEERATERAAAEWPLDDA